MEEARYRMELESLAADLEPRVASSWPETFAGLWLRIDGPPGLMIAFTDDPSGEIAELRSGFARPDALNGVQVDRSLSELRTLQQKLISERTTVQLGSSGPIPPAIIQTGGF